jgi:predicted MPP superfamily phosphohydrolase
LVNPQPAAIEQRIIFVGDAGKATAGDAVWAKLDKHLTKDALVVFLGDNVYEYGLPDESENDSSYELYASRLKAQINAAKRARKTIFIPGNHDWKNSSANGRQRILAQQRFVTKHGAHFAPQNGCADIAAEPRR